MSSKKYLELEAGENLVQFIVRQCAISDREIESYNASIKGKPPVPGASSPDELRSLCDDIINISATAVPCMEVVLWPFLFEFLIDPKYTDAIAILTKCIGALATKKREEWESGRGNESAKDCYIIDFDRHVNIPRPPVILARLFVLCTGAMRRNKQEENILEMLRACGPIFHPEVQNLWDHSLIKLVQFIPSKASAWSQQQWEDFILRLMAEAIKVIVCIFCSHFSFTCVVN